jgi:hypothetical protein
MGPGSRGRALGVQLHPVAPLRLAFHSGAREGALVVSSERRLELLEALLTMCSLHQALRKPGMFQGSVAVGLAWGWGRSMTSGVGPVHHHDQRSHGPCHRRHAARPGRAQGRGK